MDLADYAADHRVTLSDNQVALIRNLAESGWTHAGIARFFAEGLRIEVSEQHVGRIARGEARRGVR